MVGTQNGSSSSAGSALDIVYEIAKMGDEEGHDSCVVAYSQCKICHNRQLYKAQDCG
jgi:hypothetical protein